VEPEKVEELAPNPAPGAQPEGSEGDNVQEDEEPAEHPYTRFCAKCLLLKLRIEELDGETARYYQVFGTHGFENKGQVPKGQTKVMREIVLDLMKAVEEAQAEKATLAAETLDGEAEDAETGEKIEKPVKDDPGHAMPEVIEAEAAQEIDSPDDKAEVEDAVQPEDKNELPFD